LQANRCDIVWTALFVNAKRLAVAEAVPYLTTGHEVLVPAGNPENIKTLTDLCGKKVSIQSGGLVEDQINQQSTACTTGGKPAIATQYGQDSTLLAPACPHDTASMGCHAAQ